MPTREELKMEIVDIIENSFPNFFRLIKDETGDEMVEQLVEHTIEISLLGNVDTKNKRIWVKR